MLLILEGIASFFFKNWKVLLVGGAVVTVLLTGMHFLSAKDNAAEKLQQQLNAQQVALKQTEQDRDTNAANFVAAKAVADTNEEAIKALAAQNADNAAARHALGMQLAASKKFSDDLRNYINNSSPTQDGPLSPVLRETVERIQYDRTDRTK